MGWTKNFDYILGEAKIPLILLQKSFSEFKIKNS